MRNRHAGYCINCGKFVDKFQGHPERKNGRWFVRCLACVRGGRL